MAMRSFDDMNTWFDEMDRFFEQMRSRYTQLPQGERDAATSLVEQDDEYVFVMDLPGFEREDIALTYHDGMLSVSAHREADEEGTFRSRHADKRLSIPGEIVVEDISASYRNGVLEVHLPRIVAEIQADEGHHIDIED